jgi:hypothetical protein
VQLSSWSGRWSALPGRAAVLGAAVLVTLICGQAWPADAVDLGSTNSAEVAYAAELWRGWSDPCERFWTTAPAANSWTIDYRIQQMFDSRTSYQFGTAPQFGPPQYAPLSKLDWSLDSTWTGLRVGVQKPNWDVHFEWLTTMGQGINGSVTDSDWNGPATDPCSVSVSPERWNDGQKVEVEAHYQWSECLLGLPIELWPLAGFRFQRFDMTAHDGLQVVNTDLNFNPVPVGYQWTGDMGTFNQQYYIGYAGAQLRAPIGRAGQSPITVTLQADYGATLGYNVDHHISGYEDAGIHRYTMESTTGSSLHFALTAEALLNKRLTFGLQADHTEINTTGSHHWVESGATPPVDETWSNGVSVSSHQTTLTAFLRLRI